MRRTGLIAALILAAALPLSALSAGSRVETRENIAYALPNGWTVKMFSQYDGVATLQHGVTSEEMRVSRRGIAGPVPDAYAHKETLTGGRILTWQYDTINTFIFLLGRVSLTGAYVEMSITVPDMKGRPTQEVGLAAMRRIAQTAAVLGPRGCVGRGDDCGVPGVVKPD